MIVGVVSMFFGACGERVLEGCIFGQIGEGSQVPLEDDRGGHAWRTRGETNEPCGRVDGSLE